MTARPEKCKEDCFNKQYFCCTKQNPPPTLILLIESRTPQEPTALCLK